MNELEQEFYKVFEISPAMVQECSSYTNYFRATGKTKGELKEEPMSKIEELLSKLKQLFCNYTYIDGYKIDANDNVFGYYRRCTKCGKTINL